MNSINERNNIDLKSSVCTKKPGGGGGGYSLCKAIRGCAALVGHFFEKNP